MPLDPLLAAAVAGDAALVTELLAGGADLECTQEADERTPLHCAAALGHLEVVRVLLEGGADVDAEDEVRV